MNTKCFKRFLISSLFINTCFFCILASLQTLYCSEPKFSDTLRPRYGGFIGADFNLHTADFIYLPNVETCCPLYESGFGIGASVGFLYEVPLSDYFLFGLRTGYYSKRGVLTKDEPVDVMVGLKETPGIFQHRLEGNIAALALEPMFSYRLDNNLFLHLGGQGGIFIQNSFDQIEEVIKPEKTGVFKETGTRFRNPRDGTIDSMAAFHAGISAGISYELPLKSDGTLLIVPELFINIGLTDFVQNRTWKAFGARAGVAIKYTPFETIHIHEQNIDIDTIEQKTELLAEKTIIFGTPKIEKREEISRDTVFHIEDYSRIDTLFIPIEKPKPKVDIKPEKKKLHAQITAMGVLPSGERTPVGSFLVKVQLTKEVFPMLPFIFFAQGSSNLPDRYIQYPPNKQFNLMDIIPNPVNYHRNNLNIIADRLAQNPEAKISLYGYVDPTTEMDNCTLAKARANEVKRYLVENRGIDSSRIIIKAANVPCYPNDLTRTQSEMGYAENRRVEIESDNPEILAPVTGERYQKPQIIAPRTIEFDPKGSSYDDVERWSLCVFQDNYKFVNKLIDGKPELTTHDISEKDVLIIKSGTPLSVEYKIYNNEGESASAVKDFRVIIDTAETEVESLTLTLFKVSQANLDNQKRKEISKFIEDLDNSAIINITGYCDILGDAEMNRALSKTRASEVNKFINSITSTAKVLSVDGIGSDQLPPGVNSYDTPEERFICRTVEINIRKKLVK